MSTAASLESSIRRVSKQSMILFCRLRDTHAQDYLDAFMTVPGALSGDPCTFPPEAASTVQEGPSGMHGMPRRVRMAEHISPELR